jgi:hypothetical protein
MTCLGVPLSQWHRSCRETVISAWPSSFAGPFKGRINGDKIRRHFPRGTGKFKGHRTD